jgi:hypothetical protein
MNAESVIAWLEAVGVPPEVVSVGGEADDAWCIVRDDNPGEDGQFGWEVFWREQGNRYDWARFSNEQVACFYLFGRLTWTQVARRAILVKDAENNRATAADGTSADVPHAGRVSHDMR